jgi:hypothetical protein
VVYVYLDSRMTDELKSGRNESWPSGGMTLHLAEGYEKNHKILSQYSWCPGRE